MYLHLWQTLPKPSTRSLKEVTMANQQTTVSQPHNMQDSKRESDLRLIAELLRDDPYYCILCTIDAAVAAPSRA